MSDARDLPTLERPAFFDGQRLFADDLTAAQRLQEEMRWLHNRALHGWGIAAGFAVAGARGDKVVRVKPGLALDAAGHELLSDETVELEVPAVAGTLDGKPVVHYLTVSYAERTEPAVQRAGACGTAGAVRRPERARLRWQSTTDADPDTRYRPGFDVVLGTFAIQNCRLAQAVSLADRRSVLVAAERPRLAAGNTAPCGTVWRLWPQETGASGVATTVPTAQGRFRGVPRYQAHVVGERRFQLDAGAGVTLPCVVDGYAHVANATASSFELRVTLPGGIFAAAGADQMLNPPGVLTPAFMERLQNELGWYVVWSGVEG